MSGLFRALKLSVPLTSVPSRQRFYNAVVIPSRNKMGTAEMVLLGSAMVASWVSIPIWVLVHIRHYNGQI